MRESILRWRRKTFLRLQKFGINAVRARNREMSQLQKSQVRDEFAKLFPFAGKINIYTLDYGSVRLLRAC